MKHSTLFARLMLLVGAMVLAGGLSAVCLARGPLEYPPPCSCKPNVQNWGYYQPHWRVWPGDAQRPERVNPRKIGSEETKTPQGQEEVPLPRTTVPKPPRPMTPEEELPLPEGRIAPPEGLMLPPDGHQEPPLEPSLDNPAVPLHEGDLPGVQPKGLTPPPPQPQPPAPQLQPQQPPVPKATPPAANGAPKPEEKREPPPAKSSSSAMPKPKTDAPAKPNQGNAQTDAPIQPVGGIEPERRKSLTSANRADPISLVIPEQHGGRAQPAAYLAEEEAGMAEVGDNEYVPPVALNGYCPVDLNLNGQWTLGDLRWTVIHKGKIYRLSGDRQRREFLANPDRFAPANGGNDPVSLLDQGQTAPGRMEFCAVYEGRLYMFSNAENQARFNQSPQRYAAKRWQP